MYSKKVMDHFRNPRNAGELKGADAIGEVGNPACGDVMKVQINVKDGRIVDAKFLTFGCCAAIAASDAVCELVKGKTLEEAIALTKQDVIDYLGGELPQLKIHCSILGIDALKAAIEDYKHKSSGQ
ncbi:iron-sulfur cluster assembly scaffold protein [Candidatus Woesearchaeota archaeon]|nr:iron-sulfur cluster assembly scaffold protein [Candidatus Woesearchaeota archaeon]